VLDVAACRNVPGADTAAIPLVVGDMRVIVVKILAAGVLIALGLQVAAGKMSPGSRAAGPPFWYRIAAVTPAVGQGLQCWLERPGFLGGCDLWEGWGSWYPGSSIPLSCGNGQ
jgi:hypothetical protein